VTDPFYLSPEWRGKGALRQRVLDRDGHQCVSCGERATIVDHIVSRRNGGADAMHNLRSLCRRCDNRIKERADGTRGKGGSMRGPIGVDGWPKNG